MRRYVVLLLTALLAWTAQAKCRIKVVDSEDSTPLAAATVFANSGIIIGLTDDQGFITIASDSDFPVTVKCLGYDPGQSRAGEAEVRLEHSVFELQEVVVTPVDRPVLRVLCYIREYVSGATSTDTLVCYNEHMGDFFLPTRKKIKGFKAQTSPRFLRSRCYSRMANNDGLDSIFVPKYRDDSFCWEDLVSMPSENVTESDIIKSGSNIDSIQGKHGVKQILRKSSESTYTIQTDYLADSKNHKISPFIFKLLGLSIDITELQGSWIYQTNEGGVYSPADIVSGIFSLSVSGRGKWIKKAFRSETPVQMHSFYEIYPIEVEYLTVEEAKDLLYENPPRVSMTISPNATPLDPSTQRMVDICNLK